MLVRLLLILTMLLTGAFAEATTYSVAGPNDSPSIVALRQKLRAGDTAAVKSFWESVRKSGAP